MSLQLLEQQVRQTLEEWETARREEAEIRRLYVATGSRGSGSLLLQPEKVFDAAGLKAVQEAEENTRRKWARHQEGLVAWREALGQR